MFNLIPPAFIKYTDDLPSGVVGRARMFFVEIRKGYEADKGILMHELAHVSVWWFTLGVLAHVSKKFRIWNEVRAYGIQTKHPNKHGGYMTIDEAAARLASPHYGFNLTHEQAKQHILDTL